MEEYLDPSIVVWELTLKCNLKCLHCGSSAGLKRTDELTTKEALKLCNDLSELGFKGISLMGGEVLLRKDWEIISKEIKDLGIALSIITNGFFNPEKIIPKLVKLKTDCVMIGLDGSSPEMQDKIRNVKGAYKKAVDFARASKKANLPTGIITTVHKINFKELNKILDFVLKEEIIWQIQEASPIGRFPKELVLSNEEYYSLGLFVYAMEKKYNNKNFSIVGTHNFGFHSKILPNLSTYPEWTGCPAGKTVLGIQSNGNVKGCLALPDEFVEGNIREKNIKKIWKDPNTFSYTRNFDLKNIGELCKTCKYVQSCKGGCTTRSSCMTGIPHNDPCCFHRYEKEVLNLE